MRRRSLGAGESEQARAEQTAWTNMVPIEPERPAEPPAESGGLEGFALRTVLLPGEQTPDHGRQTNRDRQRNTQNETQARSASATDRRHQTVSYLGGTIRPAQRA